MPAWKKNAYVVGLGTGFGIINILLIILGASALFQWPSIKIYLMNLKRSSFLLAENCFHLTVAAILGQKVALKWSQCEQNARHTPSKMKKL